MDMIFALVLATATPGGGFPVYGDAFADMVNAQEPRSAPDAIPGSHFAFCSSLPASSTKKAAQRFEIQGDGARA